MKLLDIFLTASSNMLRSKLRTILTVLAIFIGAFTLTLTNGIGSGISSYVDRQVSNLGQKDVLTITAKSTSSNLGGSDAPQKYEAGTLTSGGSARGPAQSYIVLTAKDINALTQDKDLANVQPTLSVSPDYIQGANGQQYLLTSSQVGVGTQLDLAAGSQLSAKASENQLVLPLGYVSALGYASASAAVGKQVAIGITDATGVQHILTATIVGVQQKGLVGSSGAVFNDVLRNNMYNLQSIGLPAAAKGKYESVTAKIAGSLSDAHISSVKSKLNDMGYSATTTEDQLGTFKTVLHTITYVLDAFAVIALLAASFGIVNTLFMAVQERTKEIGLMKAMGMRKNRIFLLFSLEAVLIGFWGSAIGIAMAELVGILANKVTSNGLLKDLPGFNLLAFPATSVATILVIIMGIAFLAGTLPARRAANQSPIDALRYE